MEPISKPLDSMSTELRTLVFDHKLCCVLVAKVEIIITGDRLEKRSVCLGGASQKTNWASLLLLSAVRRRSAFSITFHIARIVQAAARQDLLCGREERDPTPPSLLL